MLFLLWAQSVQRSDETGEIPTLIERLASDEVEIREDCSLALKRLGPKALPVLEKAREHPDPEVAARARDLHTSISNQLSLDELSASLDHRDIDLRTLTRAVWHITGRRFLWDGDLGLERREVRNESDLTLRSNPDLLWKVYQSTLQANELVAIPLGEESGRVYTIKPSPNHGKRGGPPIGPPR